MSDTPVLEVRNLKKHYRMKGKQVLKAVDGVSFDLRQGETLGIVGESGCGKTTCGKVCMGMLAPTEGQVLFHGQDVHRMDRKAHRIFTRQAQMIFQDPYGALDPHYTVYRAVAEGLRAHGMARTKQEQQQMVYQLLDMVGLRREQAVSNVSEFSGGQRQRISIARALAVNPEFLFCDEPVSALDVSLQAQIVNLLLELQKKRNLTMLIISHDLAVVKHISDRVAVMYLGRIVELAPAEELYRTPLHPYTRALLSAIPEVEPEGGNGKDRILLKGDLPSAIADLQGCRFCSRCPCARDICARVEPELREISPGHTVACHFPGEEGETPWKK